ncbi:MAG: WG repeat-containing protein [Duncaniella sp.]|uniref:WG repeat-containing protein n=1 Tax=Duncaniella sp. TaxID=2518496 RepID=UPI0023CD6895|nr:WG repeat-containing protein [Duncaniella sp.]MDE5989313.1 WG repeat-containing protein [Duncaniella sp.]
MKKSLVSILLCLLFAGATPVSAQGFLKDLKNKAGKTLKDAGRSLSPASTSAAKAGASTSTKASSSATDSSNASDEADETPDALKGIHHGSIDDLMLFPAPQTTASTVRITVENDMPAISSFYDGAAYIYSYPQKAFFIDKKGRKLFETDMAQSDLARMPRFEQGVFMEIPSQSVKKPICIRDKQGRVVKEFPKASSATQFKDGKAIIVEDEINYMHTVRYVDTKGNYIYPDLSYKVKSLYLPSLESANRKTSEGLTAFCIKNGDNDNWKWGFYNSLGKIAIAADYDAVGDFHDGLAAVMKVDNGVARWGFIDKNGRQVIAPRFTVKPSDFDSGYSLVIDKAGDGYYMDRSGQFKLGPVHKYPAEKDGNYVYISPFHNGYAVVGVEVKETYGHSVYFFTVDANLNRLGWAKLTTSLDMTCQDFICYEGRYYIKQNYGGGDRWMQINPRNFDRIGEGDTNIFSDGLRLYNRSQNGFVNDNNELVIVVEESKF